MSAEHDAEWRRDVQRRIDELEEKVSTTISKVDRLVERQQLQHAENTKRMDVQEESIERIAKMLIGEKGDNGLVGHVTKLDGKITLASADISVVKGGVQELKADFRHLPKTLFLYLSILLALIALLTFLGPSLRKAVGLPAAHVPTSEIIGHSSTLDSSIPATIARR